MWHFFKYISPWSSVHCFYVWLCLSQVFHIFPYPRFFHLFCLIFKQFKYFDHNKVFVNFLRVFFLILLKLSICVQGIFSIHSWISSSLFHSYLPSSFLHFHFLFPYFSILQWLRPDSCSILPGSHVELSGRVRVTIDTEIPRAHDHCIPWWRGHCLHDIAGRSRARPETPPRVSWNALPWTHLVWFAQQRRYVRRNLQSLLGWKENPNTIVWIGLFYGEVHTSVSSA